MQTTILHIHSTEVRPKAKSQVKPKPKKKQQKPKTKSQESSEAKAKSQKPNGHATWLQTAANSTQIRDFGSEMQQIQARSQKLKEPEAKSQKPNGHANWLQTAANSTQIRDFGSKMQQIQARSQKPKEPEAKSQKPEAKKKMQKKIPLQSKNLFGAQNRVFARTVQKKHVENDWLSYHFPIMSNPLPYASLCSSMLRYADGISWWFTRAMPSAGSLCDQYKQPYVRRTNQCTLQWWVWSCYKRKSYVSLLRHTTGPWIWLVTWLPQGRFQAIHPKQPRHARTMLRSYDAKQCSFRNHKAESITGVETNPRKVALKQKVPVPLKQTKTRERPKSLVMRYIPKWWMVCWTKIKI